MTRRVRWITAVAAAILVIAIAAVVVWCCIPAFDGTVEQVTESSILVRGLDSNDNHNFGSWSLTWCPVADAAKFHVGQRVRVTYIGSILETYPGQLTGWCHVWAIDP